jgi:putative inorganic carbon (hco3(-)) transporter
VSLRDLFLFGVLAVLVFTVPRRPFVGAMAWVVFGIMNPHRLTWGAAYDFPFSQVIALLTLVGIVFTKEHRKLKGGLAAALLVVLFLWTSLNSVFAFYPAESFQYLDRVFKVYLMTFILLLLTHTREQVNALIWCLVVSLGFYGTKGGVFVFVTLGGHMVNGPPGSVMEGNNSLGVGLVIVIPLMYYLLQVSTNRWVRWGLMGSMALCTISVLGSYSRGALLAIVAMGGLLWLRGKHKLPLLVGLLVFALVAVPFMPDRWFDRMNTLKTYDQDASAMGRINAWHAAFNIAKDRVPLGGGLEWQGIETSRRYSPVPDQVLVAHSIYFQVVGAVGFIGLGLFLWFWWLVWRLCSTLRRETHGRADLHWAHVLASMVQVSLVGYLIGGAFLDLAFWDLPYYLFAAACCAQYAVRQTSAERPAAVAQPAPPGQPAPPLPNAAPRRPLP